MAWWVELVKTLFEPGPSGAGWALLAFSAALWMRARMFRQLKIERDHQLEEQERALDLQLKSFELLMKQHELRRLNGRAPDGDE